MLGIYQKENYIHRCIKIYVTNINRRIVHNSPNWKCPSRVDRKWNMRATEENFTNILLNKRRETQKNTYQIISFVQSVKMGKGNNWEWYS